MRIEDERHFIPFRTATNSVVSLIALPQAHTGFSSSFDTN
jgi:hypothetical protein